MYSHERAALERISGTLRKRYSDNIISVYAFGSRVRGDHTAGSDFDILVIVRERSVPIEEAIVDAFVEEEMESGLFFDPVIKSLDSYELEKRHHTPFSKSIEQEGVPL